MHVTDQNVRILRFSYVRPDRPLRGADVVASTGSTWGSVFFARTPRGALYTNGRLGARKGKVSVDCLTPAEVEALHRLGVFSGERARSILLRIRDRAIAEEVSEAERDLRSIERRSDVKLVDRVRDAILEGIKRREGRRRPVSTL